ncbi:MAG: hypothetical protein JWP52_2115 [Rhizobacter sp.]|nr:hypothetical protein [Rhizobacter sp.]
MTDDPADAEQAEALFAAMAIGLQFVPESAPRASRVATTVAENNARVAQASAVLLRMEDHPDTFDAWCRTFAAKGGGA